MDYEEKDVEFDSSGYRIKGTLIVPETDGPVALFIHGQGPQDRDGTVGPNKLWRDIAHGLAEEGIASLRFDKRKFTYAKSPVRDFNDETLDDVYGALDFLKESGYGDVYLVGQSSGSFLAPTIAKDRKVKGVVMMAAPARGPKELIGDQKEYQMRLKGASSDEIDSYRKSLAKVFEKIDKRFLADDVIYQGAPASYWYDWVSRKPTEDIKALDVPVLLLQGRKDCQVFEKDYRIWERILEDSGRDYEARLFDVNHMMMPVEGLSTMKEYNEPNHVGEEVIETIIKWIKDREGMVDR